MVSALFAGVLIEWLNFQSVARQIETEELGRDPESSYLHAARQQHSASVLCGLYRKNCEFSDWRGCKREMASELQIAANERNALLSTGPRSGDGKARSSQNAVTHGLTAQRVLVPGEDAGEFEALREEMYRTLDPVGAVEIQLVERATALMWRLGRIPALEAAFFHFKPRPLSPSDISMENLRMGMRDELDKDLLRAANAVAEVLKVLLNRDLLTKLNRYEVSLQRQLTMTLKDLRQLSLSRAAPEAKASA